MPVGFVKSGERPRHRLSAQPVLYGSVPGDVSLIVVVDERVRMDRQVNNYGCGGEQLPAAEFEVEIVIPASGQQVFQLCVG